MQSLKWSVISFTEKGSELAEKIKRLSKEQQLPCEIHTYHGRKQVENLNAWTKEQFSLRNAIIFIGACGIAVRTIAPFLKDKLTDSPVLVLDEAGNYVIPLLSGHVGGANEIALQLAELLGAVPVITTATDINNAFAIDVFAKKHDLSIDKKEGIKKVSAKVLEKKKLSMTIAPEYAAKVDVAIGTPEDGQKPELLLTLIPKEYILGIGCRRNKEEQELKAYFPEFRRYEEQCRFQGCRHIHEPDCGVKAALAEHKISQLRYEDYLGLYNELKEKRRF